MKETPILFSAPMVRAILEGRKSQTRRIIKMTKDEIKDAKWGYTAFTPPGKISVRGYHADGRYGESFIGQPFHVGDILWVRETHYAFGYWKKNGKTDGGRQKWKFIRESDDILFDPWTYDDNCGTGIKLPLQILPNSNRGTGYYKRLGRFMPKKFARTWLEITKVRAQRLQEISDADALAEGIISCQLTCGWDSTMYRDYMADASGYGDPAVDYPLTDTAVKSFSTLWQSINGAESWEANPWIFAVSFKVISTTGKPQNL